MRCFPRQESSRSNGALVRCFGRNGCQDGCMALILSCILAVFLLPVFAFQLLRACLARRKLKGRRGDCCLQLFSFASGCGSMLDQKSSFEESLRRQCIESGGEEHYIDTKLRFVCLSDTHMQHAKINVPEGDVLIHTGDFTNHGTYAQTLAFIEWFAALPHRIKICVPGNHDMIMDEAYWKAFWSDWVDPDDEIGTGAKARTHRQAMDAFRDRGIHVLIDSSLHLKVTPSLVKPKVEAVQKPGKNTINIFGSPWVTRYASWETAFNKLDAGMKSHWERLSEAYPYQEQEQSIDLLLTHMPPKGIGDMEPGGQSHGCPHLLDAVKKISPAVHIFGHVHSDTGVVTVESNESKRIHFINAASVCDYYFTGSRKPISFDLCPRLENNGRANALSTSKKVV